MNVCEQCGRTEGVEAEDSRTNYPEPILDIWDRLLLDGADPPSPNDPLFLCRDCAKEHHEYFDEVYKEYYAGLL